MKSKIRIRKKQDVTLSNGLFSLKMDHRDPEHSDAYLYHARAVFYRERAVQPNWN